MKYRECKNVFEEAESGLIRLYMHKLGNSKRLKCSEVIPSAYGYNTLYSISIFDRVSVDS